MDSTSRFRRLFANRLVRAMGLSALTLPAVYTASCGGTAVIDADDGSGGATSSNATSTSNTSVTGPSSTVVGTSVTSSSTGGGCVETTTTVGGGIPTLHYTRCLDNLNTPCPANTAQAEVVISNLLQTECCIDPNFECEVLQSADCGPFDSSMGECCFEITTTVEPCSVPGRPYMVDNRAWLAEADQREGWHEDPRPCVGALREDAREALAAFWSRSALAEHASIASFSRFALQLMAVGAPSDLVADAHRAALDEVEHARLAFGLASAYADAPVGPGAFPIGDAQTAVDLPSLAAATAAEGCVNETLAVLLAVEQLANSSDPHVERALQLIVADEMRHAELAWRTVAWALREGGDEVREAVSAAFDAAVYGAPDASELADEQLAAHGLIDRDTARRALAHGLRDVVLPSARALLAA